MIFVFESTSVFILIVTCCCCTIYHIFACLGKKQRKADKKLYKYLNSQHQHQQQPYAFAPSSHHHSLPSSVKKQIKKEKKKDKKRYKHNHYSLRGHHSSPSSHSLPNVERSWRSSHPTPLPVANYQPQPSFTDPPPPALLPPQLMPPPPMPPNDLPPPMMSTTEEPGWNAEAVQLTEPLGWNAEAMQPQAQPSILIPSTSGQGFGRPSAQVHIQPAVVHPAPAPSRHARSVREPSNYSNRQGSSSRSSNNSSRNRRKSKR